MHQTKIFLQNLDHVKRFVEMTAKYDKLKINLISDIYTIDAHSIIGIVSLDISSPIILEVPEEEPPQEFLEDIQQFAFQENK